MINELKDQIQEAVNKEDNLKKGLSLLYEFSKENDTIYYRDIISIFSTFYTYQSLWAAGIISHQDETDLKEYLKNKLLELTNDISKEQNLLLEENLRFIKRELEMLQESISKLDEDDIIRGFNSLFLKIHSRYYKPFLKLISEEYNPKKQSIYEYQGLRTLNLIEIRDKVLFEKELIHKEILKNEILKNEKVKSLIDLLSNGKVEIALEDIENTSIKIINEIRKGKKILGRGDLENQVRKPLELSFRFWNIKKLHRQGILAMKDYVIETKEIVDEILEYVEFAYRKNLEFLITGELKVKSDFISEEDRGKVKKLVAKAELDEALDLLYELIPEDNREIKNQIIIQKSRIKENELNLIRGLEYDEKIFAKIANSILLILDELN